MKGQIITVAQQKGGAGKTTLAAHLGVGLASAKRRVALLDADPQGSLSQWWALRADLVGPHGTQLQLFSSAGEAARPVLDRLSREFDLVLIDSPPHAQLAAETLIKAADLVVVPLQPSALDLWATRATLTLAKIASRRVLLVLNRVPARSGLADEMIQGAAAFGAQISEVRLGNRVGFAAAMALGRTVLETTPKASAGREMQRLVREVATTLSI
jgi:chromosome partitioning protein